MPFVSDTEFAEESNSDESSDKEKTTSSLTPASQVKNTKNVRYISKEKKHFIWQRDGEKCTKCGGSFNLQIDHRKPVALGGSSDVNNLRLLCFHCNQREALKFFSLEDIERWKQKPG